MQNGYKAQVPGNGLIKAEKSSRYRIIRYRMFELRASFRVFARNTDLQKFIDKAGIVC